MSKNSIPDFSKTKDPEFAKMEWEYIQILKNIARRNLKLFNAALNKKAKK